MKIIAVNNSAATKTKKISARVTPAQKAAVLKRMEECGYTFESEYVLTCCLKGCKETLTSEYQLQLLQHGNTDRLEIRVTKSEREMILQKFKESNMSNFSRFIRNCCMNNPIIVVNGLKECTAELHKIGTNLNQLTMLCHQGLITAPDMKETQEVDIAIRRQLMKNLFL